MVPLLHRLYGVDAPDYSQTEQKPVFYAVLRLPTDGLSGNVALDGRL